MKGKSCEQRLITKARVESELDDPENMGHFFGGSSGSHPVICKLNYLDMTWTDITCSLESSVGIW